MTDRSLRLEDHIAYHRSITCPLLVACLLLMARPLLGLCLLVALLCPSAGEAALHAGGHPDSDADARRSGARHAHRWGDLNVSQAAHCSASGSCIRQRTRQRLGAGLLGSSVQTWHIERSTSSSSRMGGWVSISAWLQVAQKRSWSRLIGRCSVQRCP